MPGGLWRLDNQMDEGDEKERKRVGTDYYIGTLCYEVETRGRLV